MSTSKPDRVLVVTESADGLSMNVLGRYPDQKHAIAALRKADPSDGYAILTVQIRDISVEAPVPTHGNRVKLGTRMVTRSPRKSKS